MELGSTYIASRLFIVKPWKPFIEQELSTLKTVPIWVNLINIPYQFWTEKGLSLVASYLGTPLMLDAPTLEKKRLDFARVCVEIDIDCEFPTDFDIHMDRNMKVVIGVEYAWKPARCSHCGAFGHTLEKCEKKPRVFSTKQRAARPATSHQQPIPKATVGMATGSAEDSDEWLTITKGKAVSHMHVQRAPASKDLADVRHKARSHDKHGLHAGSSNEHPHPISSSELVVAPKGDIVLANRFDTFGEDAADEVMLDEDRGGRDEDILSSKGLQIRPAGAVSDSEIGGSVVTAHELSYIARGGNPKSNCL